MDRESATSEMIEVLAAARELLSRPGNDFDWSSWQDADAAVRELDAHIAALRAAEAGGGPLPSRVTLGVLFAPTGPMQEVSLNSGWSSEFNALADRFDRAEAALYGPVRRER
jgi:hypothetical protein